MKIGEKVNSGKLYNFFWTSKTMFFVRITEPSNDDYDNDVSDNCDHNLVLLMILVLKMTKKYHIT